MFSFSNLPPSDKKHIGTLETPQPYAKTSYGRKNKTMILPFRNKYGIEPSKVGIKAANKYLAKRKVEKQIIANDGMLLYLVCLCLASILLILVLGELNYVL